ncbi:hypothetical protein JHK84_049415 [Glycine max]|nr:hypothetical protein JHK84_049415 [Glycine max]
MALLHSLFALPFLLLSLQLHTSSCALLLSLRHHHNTLHQQRPMIHANQTNCALFVGTWVQDDSYPLYQSSNCPIIDPQFNCKLFGRPDSDYLRYRWRPLNCDLPRAPYLVEIDVVQGKRILRLEEVDGNGDAWRSADVLSFNTGHWWDHQGSLQGWDYMELGGKYYQDMDRLAALERGIKTWANWVDSNIDSSRTKVFFLGISPSHTNPNEWNSGVTAGLTTKNCYGETSPIISTGTAYPGVYPEQMRVVDMVIREMSNPAYLLDITMLSAFRKDAHPSIYSGDLNPQQRANPTYSADCSHWCLPGLPDTWNELFYTALFY